MISIQALQSTGAAFNDFGEFAVSPRGRRG
jgi:hypothetical protein